MTKNSSKLQRTDRFQLDGQSDIFHSMYWQVHRVEHVQMTPGAVSAAEKHKQKDVLNKFMDKMCLYFKSASGECERNSSPDSSLLKWTLAD